MTIHTATEASNTARYDEPKPIDGLFDEQFRPLTADEAQSMRASQPPTSLWRIVVWQVLAGAVVALLAGVWVDWNAGVSAAYGALAVVLPAALMVRGLQRQRGVTQPGAAMLGFVIWELVKIAATVAMLVVAPKLIQPLHWLALVGGFVLTMKVYWVTAWLDSGRRIRNVSN